MVSENSRRQVKSAARTVELLEYIAERAGCTLTMIQKDLGHPKSSLHVLLRTLVDAGWIESDVTNTRYSLGVRTLLVGTAFIDGSDIIARVGPFLEHLRDSTGETVHLARLNGPDVIYLATFESRHYLRVHSRVGRRQPAHSTSLGKAILAGMPDDTVLALLPPDLKAQTPKSITSATELLRDLDLTRSRGYAIDEEENELGLKCVGVRVHGMSAEHHAISCSVPLGRLGQGRLDEIAAALVDTSRSIDGVLASVRVSA